MSDRCVQVFREANEAWNRADLDWFRGRHTDDIEIRPLPGVPGIDEVYYGWDGWEVFWNAWHDAWEKVTIAIDQVDDLGDEGVRALITFDGVGRESGAPVTLTAVQLTTFAEDGRFASVLAFWPEDAKRRWPDLDV